LIDICFKNKPTFYQRGLFSFYRPDLNLVKALVITLRVALLRTW
jgi:hypothetical protein